MTDCAATSPRLMADQTAHDLVVRLLKQDLEELGSNHHLIDIPCGAGALSVRMRDLGCDVDCCDIDKGNFTAEHFKHIQADLNRALPIESQSYDIVVSVAGIQRLHNPENAIYEFYRILKPGGRLYLGSPNFSTLRRRLHYFWYGSLGFRFDKPSYDQTIDLPEANARFPITMSRILHIFDKTGFQITQAHGVLEENHPYRWLPLTILIKLHGILQQGLKPKRYTIYKRGNQIAMLGSKIFVLVAQKPEA